jgi:hypothetical protein
MEKRGFHLNYRDITKDRLSAAELVSSVSAAAVCRATGISSSTIRILVLVSATGAFPLQILD